MAAHDGCDAARTLLAMGCEDPHCSTPGLVEVWHGMSTPAYACDYHATQRGIALLNVFRGHRARLGESVMVTVLTDNGPSFEYHLPTGEQSCVPRRSNARTTAPTSCVT